MHQGIRESGIQGFRDSRIQGLIPSCFSAGLVGELGWGMMHLLPSFRAGRGTELSGGSRGSMLGQLGRRFSRSLRTP